MYNFILKKLSSQTKPIDIILVGLGFMGYGILQYLQHIPGMRVIVLITRNIERSSSRLNSGGFKYQVTNILSKIRKNRDQGILSVCNDYKVISGLDCKIVLDMTGEIAYGTEVALETLNSGKHLVTMNCELQVTLGSELQKYANDRNLMVTDVQGDQPGSLASLISEVKLFGFDILMAGNLKGFLNRYATPDLLVYEAEKRGITLKQVTSFTDGTKIALEMALVANYFGMEVLTPGMYGYPVDDVNDILSLYRWDKIPPCGCVDYVIGLTLPAGIFVVGKHKDINQIPYLRYLKLGTGPHYMLFRPFHLCHLETPLSIAKLYYMNEITINNSLKPKTQVVAFAKKDLNVGEKIDNIGGYCCYGLIYNIDRVKKEKLAPIGLVEGAIVSKKIIKDQPIPLTNIELPDNSAVQFLKFMDKQDLVEHDEF